MGILPGHGAYRLAKQLRSEVSHYEFRNKPIYCVKMSLKDESFSHFKPKIPVMSVVWSVDTTPYQSMLLVAGVFYSQRLAQIFSSAKESLSFYWLVIGRSISI